MIIDIAKNNFARSSLVNMSLFQTRFDMSTGKSRKM